MSAPAVQTHSLASAKAAQRPAPLPIPELSLTLQRYLVSIAPFVTTDAFKESAVRCLRFFQNTCEHGKITGLRLHDMLVEKARLKQREGKSWLIDDWVRVMYSTWRLPLPCNVSYWYLVSEKVFKSVDAIAADDLLATKASFRAAALVLRAAQFRDLIFHGLIPLEQVEDGALDTNMYRYIFHTCRMPRTHEDGVRVYDGNAATAPLDCVVVLRKGQMFVVSLHSASSANCRVGLQELARRFSLVATCADAETTPMRGMVQNLTSGHRDTWAQAFPLIFGAGASLRPSHHVNIAADPALEIAESSDPTERHNMACLQTIESSLCVVCFDDHHPDTLDARSRNLLDGHTSNRWFDKTAQFVIADNGVAGFIGEHSYCDGMPTAVAMAWMTARIQQQPGIDATENEYMQKAEKGIPAGNRIVPTLPEGFSRLDIRVPDSVEPRMRAAVSEIQAQRDGHDSFALRWSAYGREAVKHAGVSPMPGPKWLFNWHICAGRVNLFLHTSQHRLAGLCGVVQRVSVLFLLPLASGLPLCGCGLTFLTKRARMHY
jgi:carnitine O-acetyltransferase